MMDGLPLLYPDCQSFTKFAGINPTSLFSFFKVNNPYRLVVVFLLALALKLPCLLSDCAYFDMTHWLLISEAMGKGMLYRDIIDPLAPLAAMVYRLVYLVAGRSVVTLHILGLLVLCWQAVIFNNMAIRNKVYTQNTYLPALVYVLLGSVHYSMSVFSPVQLGLTFVLLAFDKLLSHVEFRAKRDEQIMSIGLLLGLATLFYVPFILLLPVVLLILAFFTSTIPRRYVVLTISALMPPVLTLLYYWLRQDSAYYVVHHLVQPSLSFSLRQANHTLGQAGLFALPLTLWLLGLLTMPRQRRLNNYQRRLAALFLFTGLLTLPLYLFLQQADTVTLLLLLLPVAAFSAVHLFFLVNRPVADWLYSLLVLAALLFVHFDSAFGRWGYLPLIEQKVEVEPALADLLRGRRILVLGDEQQLYAYGSLGSGFYYWPVAAYWFADPHDPQRLLYIRRQIERFRPQVVLDYTHQWRQISERIPAIKLTYRQVRPFVWLRKENQPLSLQPNE